MTEGFSIGEDGQLSNTGETDYYKIAEDIMEDFTNYLSTSLSTTDELYAANHDSATYKYELQLHAEKELKKYLESQGIDSEDMRVHGEDVYNHMLSMIVDHLDTHFKKNGETVTSFMDEYEGIPEPAYAKQEAAQILNMLYKLSPYLANKRVKFDYDSNTGTYVLPAKLPYQMVFIPSKCEDYDSTGFGIADEIGRVIILHNTTDPSAIHTAFKKIGIA